MTRCIALALIVGATWGGAAAAADVGPTSPIQQPAADAHPQTKKSESHVLAATDLDSGTGGALSGGFSEFVSRTEICNNPKGCTIQTISMAQVYKASTTNNAWAICAYVDGASMNPTCSFIGYLPSNGFYDTSVATEYLAVAKGKHTVEVKVYTAQAATLNNWQVTYNLFVP